jgi:preprotein translocase subunit SecF
VEFFRVKTHIDFLRWRQPAFVLSVALTLIALLSLAFRGLNLGIDFTGGTLIEVAYSEAVDLEPVRSALEREGFGDAVVQHFGTARDVLVRLAPRTGMEQKQLGDRVLEALRIASTAQVELRRIEVVGPQIGEEITEQGGLAMLAALGAILLYVSLRFEFRFALGSVIALFHDVIIVLGFFSVTWLDFDLTAFAAVLAVIGYSLNDTIVVYDRIRENFRKVRRGSTIEVMNLALNETLSRTLMTGVTTLLVLVALMAFGGELLHSFTIALLVGVLFGMYSSIYVASALALALGVSRADLMPGQKESADDARP